MATFTAEINTPWVDGGVGTKARFHAKLRDDFPGVAYSDVTHQSEATLAPSPNVYCVLVKGVDEAELDAIHAHTDYFVIWRREELDPFVSDEDNIMTAIFWGEWRAYLAQHGYTQAEMDAGVGTGVSSRTNGQIAKGGETMFKARLKGTGIGFMSIGGDFVIP